MATKRILILLATILVVVIFFSVYKFNALKLPVVNTQQLPITSASNFVYAKVGFSTLGTLDFVLEDEHGNKVGYDPIKKVAYNDLPNSYYGITYAPGTNINNNVGNKVFEIKVDKSYDYKISLFGRPNEKYYFDYSMQSNISSINNRIVKLDLVLDEYGKAELHFSEKFEN